MRLKYIKLSGFKSFAEPTRLDFPGNIICIVGPNGCGKSNTLDAIRWVMGESAAKALRGGELNDVLFSGTQRRRAVSQCSVELVFDNSDHSLKGPWNRYEALSVKRVHHREQGSHFLLNQQRCRRRDIQALFDGTGLGPRSYALIGQGSINRIIESRPEQLRQMLEELAGIGHYRQRRKETLSRLEATRENLAQLTIQLSTWQEQAEALAAQCETARRHQQLTEELKTLTQTVYRGRYAQLMARLQENQVALQRQQAAFVTAQQAVEAVEKELLLNQQQLPALQAALEDARAQWHQLDKAYELARQQQAQWQRDQEQLTRQKEALLQQQTALAQQCEQLEAQKGAMVAAHTALEERLNALEPRQDQLRAEIKTRSEAVQTAERQERQLHWKLDALKQQLGSVESEHRRLQQEQARLENQRSQLQAQRAALQPPPPTEPLQTTVNEHEQAVSHQSAEIEMLQHTLEQHAAQLREQEHAVARQRETVQRLRAELEGLEAVQRTLFVAADTPAECEGVPLLDQVTVTVPRWQQAVERWLGDRLVQGRIVAAGQDALPDVVWVGVDEPGDLLDDGQRRLHQILEAPWPILREAQFVRLVDEEGVPDFLSSLAEHESVLTPSGVLYRRYARILPPKSSAEGALARQQRIETLRTELAQQQPTLQDQEATLEQMQAKRVQLEQALHEQLRRREATQKALQQHQQALLQAREAAARFEHQQAELTHQLQACAQALEVLAPQLAEVVQQLQALEDEKKALMKQWRAAEEAVQQQRQRLRRARRELEEVEQQCTQLQQQQQQQAVELARQTAELAQLETRRHELSGRLEQVEKALAQLQAETPPSLETLADERTAAQAALARAETGLHEAQQAVEHLHAQRHEAEQARNQVEQAQAKLELTIAQTQQQLQVLVQAAQEEAGLTVAQLRQQSLEATASLGAAERRLKQVKGELAQLGPVNMTAVSAWEALRAKIEALQAQMDDVQAAVAQLEASIHTIDRDSRRRLRETWKAARARFQQMFPRVFRGGEADLVWQDPEADPLEGGVLVMARPPGKRNTRIQMLSGGEKTLTALALIFAFFEMHPAPFCVLDEVDAPLDDANVLRFCELVKGMAKRLQFILITHNKTTMQMAEQLLGVTMNEPGVSRVVSVDLDAAMEMIGEEAS